jgi:quercetin 2,3-dioxygenase
VALRRIEVRRGRRSLEDMSDPVLGIVPLPAAGPWPTLDPFLFCVHHLDAYPRGNGCLAPAASLAGRQLGSDFANLDGWNMYHGQVVAGFPQHPHRGFETVTFTRSGLIDHADSLGATARYGAGDVQWMTAGAGIVHAEMFPLLDEVEPNPMEMFQIWINLPKVDKMADPHFEMLWANEVPNVLAVDANGKLIEIAVAAGSLDGNAPPAPPPQSWAARPDADVAIWHIKLEAGAIWVVPAAERSDAGRVLYVFRGDARIGEHAVEPRHAAQVVPHVDIPLIAGPGGAELLLLQGRAIGEPVVSHGPFVMNDRAGIEQAFSDYQRTGFGGWPWESNDPTNGFGAARFARRPDGVIESPSE